MGHSPKISRVEIRPYPDVDQGANIFDIFCKETDTWVPDTCLSRALTREVEYWSCDFIWMSHLSCILGNSLFQGWLVRAFISQNKPIRGSCCLGLGLQFFLRPILTWRPMILQMRYDMFTTLTTFCKINY